MEPITGAEYLARSLAAHGHTHVFFIDAVLRGKEYIAAG